MYVLTDVHRPKKGKVWSVLFKKESELVNSTVIE